MKKVTPLTPEPDEQAQLQVKQNTALHYAIGFIFLAEAVSKFAYFHFYNCIIFPTTEPIALAELFIQLLLAAVQLSAGFVIILGVKIMGYNMGVYLMFVEIVYFLLCLLFPYNGHTVPVIMFSFGYITFDIFLILICTISKKRLILVREKIGNDGTLF